MTITYDTAPKESTGIQFTENKTVILVESESGSTLRIGIGKKKEAVSLREFRRLVRKAIRLAREQELAQVHISVEELRNFNGTHNLADEELGRTFVENALMAEYEFTRYKKPTDSAFRGTETLTILEKKEVEALKMGLILGVDKGSVEPLKFIVMEYWGGQKDEHPIILVGKGITFDTGGIDLKPSDHILGMHHDMTGGATVIAAICAAAKLNLKKNVVALIPAVENAVSGEAYRPGDVLTAMDGTTVEVLNTDAEGRLVLADALTYATRYNPRLVIDVATLTGAALVVAGKRASVIMTRDHNLETTLRDLGEQSGDYVIPLPLWEEYEADLKSNVADIANVNGVGSSAKAGAGCIQGGIFLSHFTKSFPAWAHIDIASRMESIPEDSLAEGATGEPVRLLVRLIEN